MTGRSASLRIGSSRFNAGEAIATLSLADKKLGKLIDQVGEFKLTPEPRKSPFEALAESIVYQQLTGKAAATIHGRVRTLMETTGKPGPESILSLTEQELRGAGLSGSKVIAIQDLARKTMDGIVPDLKTLEAMDDDAIVERLTQIRGVGRWTVEMLLIFRLGRPDVLPINDYGVRKGFAQVYRKPELPTPKELGLYGEKWRPFRSVASWYMWRALELK